MNTITVYNHQNGNLQNLCRFPPNIEYPPTRNSSSVLELDILEIGPDPGPSMTQWRAGDPFSYAVRVVFFTWEQTNNHRKTGENHPRKKINQFITNSSQCGRWINVFCHSSHGSPLFFPRSLGASKTRSVPTGFPPHLTIEQPQGELLPLHASEDPYPGDPGCPKPDIRAEKVRLSEPALFGHLQAIYLG